MTRPITKVITKGQWKGYILAGTRTNGETLLNCARLFSTWAGQWAGPPRHRYRRHES
jgi:hypothetical protein